MTKTILLVDDKKSMQDAYMDVLEDTGHMLLSAFNGLEALDILEKTPGIDLIVLDYEMPGMNGVEFLWARSKLLELMKIPVLMCTSCPEDMEMFDVVREHGWVKTFLKKPFGWRDVEGYLAD
jgi:CheY-like chemotaxis protein